MCDLIYVKKVLVEGKLRSELSVCEQQWFLGKGKNRNNVYFENTSGEGKKEMHCIFLRSRKKFMLTPF